MGEISRLVMVFWEILSENEAACNSKGTRSIDFSMLLTVCLYRTKGSNMPIMQLPLVKDVVFV